MLGLIQHNIVITQYYFNVHEYLESHGDIVGFDYTLKYADSMANKILSNGRFNRYPKRRGKKYL